MKELYQRETLFSFYNTLNTNAYSGRPIYNEYRRTAYGNKGGKCLVSHPADSVSIPGLIILLVGVLSVFFSTLRQMLGNLCHIRPRVLFGHYNHSRIYSSVYGRRRSLTLDVVHGRR